MSIASILIVEDDADLSKAIAVRLKAAGFEIVIARDAYQAVRFERERRPDVILLDVNMPAGNGFIVHDRLTAFSDFMSPVIYMTGCGSDESERKALALGASAYLKKPIDMDALIAAIRQCLPADVACGKET